MGLTCLGDLIAKLGVGDGSERTDIMATAFLALISEGSASGKILTRLGDADL